MPRKRPSVDRALVVIGTLALLGMAAMWALWGVAIYVVAHFVRRFW